MAKFEFDRKYRSDSAYWEDFKTQLNTGDIIVVNEIEELSKWLLDLDAKLQFCADNNISIYEKKFDCEYNTAQLLNFYRFAMELKNETHREKQLTGIKNALQLKYEGKGNYGRPLANLPEDFEAEIIALKRAHKPLEVYRQKIGIKKSTFYKYAKPIADKYEKEFNSYDKEEQND